VKKVFYIIFIFFITINSHAEMKCLQGDCKNGVSGAADKSKGKTWVGTFKDGQIIDGIMRVLPDIKYKGEFKNFSPNGNGEITIGSMNGEFFAQQKGKFENGMFIKGHAKIMMENNFNYDGEMEGLEINGFGIMTFPNGDKFIGSFNDGKFHGEGEYIWSNGSSWVGNYNNDKRDGLGIFTSKKGSKTISEWRNGKYVKKYLNPNDLNASSNLINLGIKLSGQNYSYNNNNPVLFYDNTTKAMRECDGSIIAGTCSKYKSFDMRSYDYDTLYFNPANGKMQKCGNASMGRCLSFRPQPSIISNNQLFYNPRTKSMSKCLNSTNDGRCLAFGMPPIKMKNSFNTNSNYNSYFKRVPQPDELLELGLRMMSGACTLGRNCL